MDRQFSPRDGNATILLPLRCRREKNIARVSVALNNNLFCFPSVFNFGVITSLSKHAFPRGTKTSSTRIYCFVNSVAHS